MSENRAPDSGAVSPEDADRLSERFKPSWELDEAPFAAPANPSALQVLAPQPGAAPAAPMAPAPFTAPAAPLPAALVSPAQTVPTQPAPPPDPPVPAPVVPVAAPVPDPARAAAKAKHARTMVGLAPPTPIAQPAPPAAPGATTSEAAPNAFAMAVPPTPLSPAVTTKDQEGLPSVVLAPSVAPPAPARLAVHAAPTLIIARPEDDLDSIEFKRPSKAPLAIALGVLLAGGIGAFVVFGRGKEVPTAAPAPVATEAPAAPVVPPPPVVAAPAPPPPTVAPEPTPAPTKEIAPAKTSVPSEEPPPPVKTREAPQAVSPPKASPPAPKPPSPAPKPPPAKPAAPAKPSGGIVRDVPF